MQTYFYKLILQCENRDKNGNVIHENEKNAIAEFKIQSKEAFKLFNLITYSAFCLWNAWQPKMKNDWLGGGRSVCLTSLVILCI